MQQTDPTYQFMRMSTFYDIHFQILAKQLPFITCNGDNFFLDIFEIMALDVPATQTEWAKIDICLEAFQRLITRNEYKQTRVQCIAIIEMKRGKLFAAYRLEIKPDLN